MHLIPSEFVIGGVYLPPMLIAGLFGTAAAWLTAQLLNRFRLSRFLAYPPLVLLAMAVIYTVVLGTFVIPA
jgi:type II secretory pathway component PulF